MILRTSEGVYDMVQVPGKAYNEKTFRCSYRQELPYVRVLASYERGVHYVALDKYQLQVWILTKSADGQLGWIMEHVADLKTYATQIDDLCFEDETKYALWGAVQSKNSTVSLFGHHNIQENIYHAELGQGEKVDEVGDCVEEFIHEEDSLGDTADDVDGNNHGEGDTNKDRDEDVESIENSECSWNSNDYNFLSENYDDHQDPLEYEHEYYGIVGLHPYKDVILLDYEGEIMAYHLKTSRLQDLNWMYPANTISRAFPYRPCYIDALPTTKMPYPEGYSYD
jgi:hypothetical protein